MPVSIDWGTKVISVTQSYLTPLGGTNYSLDTNAFRISLKDLEDDEAGIIHPKTHNHNTVVSLGGIQYARIIEIINGYTITFENVGTPYAVSLVGSNNNILDVTNLNNVAIRSNNSAGLVQMREIQFNVFQGGIWVDFTTGTTSTVYPAGTPLQPVKYISDAVTIAQSYGFTDLYINGNYALTTGDDVSNYRIIGTNPLLSYLTIGTDALTENVEIIECIVDGTLDGQAILRNCAILNLTYVTGFIFQCSIQGTVEIGGAMPANIMACFAGANGAVINMGGTGHSLSLSNWTGDVRITNKTGPDIVNIHASASSVTLDATVTNGTGIHIDGTGQFVNESNVTPEHLSFLSTQSIWEHIRDAAQADPIHADARRVVGTTIGGSGTGVDPWGPA
jgi:hypothetical protein